MAPIESYLTFNQGDAASIPFDNTNNNGGNFASTDVYDAIVEARNTVVNTEVNATGTTTTTSGTDAVIASMTITPAAGTYLALFSSYFIHNTSGDTITISLYSGTTQKADSIRVIVPDQGTVQDAAILLQGILTVNGSQAISVQWHTSGGTATANNRTLTILRVT